MAGGAGGSIFPKLFEEIFPAGVGSQFAKRVKDSWREDAGRDAAVGCGDCSVVVADGEERLLGVGSWFAEALGEAENGAGKGDEVFAAQLVDGGGAALGKSGGEGLLELGPRHLGGGGAEAGSAEIGVDVPGVGQGESAGEFEAEPGAVGSPFPGDGAPDAAEELEAGGKADLSGPVG